MPQQQQKPVERKPYKLPIDIVQGGEPKAAGETVQLTQTQISRIEQAAVEQKHARAAISQED